MQGVWMWAERLNGKYDYMRGFSTMFVGEGGHNLLWQGGQQHLIPHPGDERARCLRFDKGG